MGDNQDNGDINGPKSIRKSSFPSLKWINLSNNLIKEYNSLSEWDCKLLSSLYIASNEKDFVKQDLGVLGKLNARRLYSLSKRIFLMHARHCRRKTLPSETY